MTTFANVVSQNVLGDNMKASHHILRNTEGSFTTSVNFLTRRGWKIVPNSFYCSSVQIAPDSKADTIPVYKEVYFVVLEKERKM